MHACIACIACNELLTELLVLRLRHPVGRIMNRLSADLSVVDLYLFMKAESRCESVVRPETKAP